MDRWALQVVEVGYRLQWVGSPAPLTKVPPLRRRPTREGAFEALQLEVQTLVGKRAVEVVDPSSSGFYGHLFTVPKASGGLRPVLDLSALNNYLFIPKFRMETPESVRQLVRQGDWAASLDLTDAYFHVLIHPSCRKWLRFVWEGRAFQFRVLPFGLNASPAVFTRVSRVVATLVRRRGVRVAMYLDDWAVLAQSREACLLALDQVLQALARLGFHLNHKKSCLEPAQQFVYLGLEFDTVEFMVRPAPHRVEKVLRTISLFADRGSATARDLHGLIGQMGSMALLLPWACLLRRPLQWAVRDRWTQAQGSWEDLLPLGPWFREAVQPWLDSSWLRSGVPLWFLPPQLSLYTDASAQGWGAHVEEVHAAGVWSAEESAYHINLLELEAVRRALLHFQSRLTSHRVLLFTDNTTVVGYVNNQGGMRSRPLSRKAECILLWCRDHSIFLTARHVSGSVNVLADVLSRADQVIQTEWSLAPSVLVPVFQLWFRPQIDLFATRLNAKLPRFVSPVADPQAWRTDALSFSWEGLSAYAYPPYALLPQVVRKAREERPNLIFVAPYWPGRPWFPDLLDLVHVPPHRLRVDGSLLTQPHNGLHHPRPRVLKLHAWRVCAPPCSH